jgi:hypothetical protein
MTLRERQEEETGPSVFSTGGANTPEAAQSFKSGFVLIAIGYR